jgi:hypothetical protein
MISKKSYFEFSEMSSLTTRNILFIFSFINLFIYEFLVLRYVNIPSLASLDESLRQYFESRRSAHSTATLMLDFLNVKQRIDEDVRSYEQRVSFKTGVDEKICSDISHKNARPERSVRLNAAAIRLQEGY